MHKVEDGWKKFPEKETTEINKFGFNITRNWDEVTVGWRYSRSRRGCVFSTVVYMKTH